VNYQVNYLVQNYLDGNEPDGYATGSMNFTIHEPDVMKSSSNLVYYHSTLD